MAIASELHSLSACIPSRQCYTGCWRTVTPTRSVMHCMTVVIRGLISHFMVYKLKQILTWGTDSRCLGEIRQCESPLMPVQSVLSVNSVSIPKSWMVNLIFFCELPIRIPRLPCRFSMPNAVSATIELVNSVTSDTVNSSNFAICAFASKCLATELVPCSDGWRRTWWQTIHMFAHWAGPMFCWMAKNLMTNDTYDAGAASLFTSAM